MINEHSPHVIIVKRELENLRRNGILTVGESEKLINTESPEKLIDTETPEKLIDTGSL